MTGQSGNTAAEPYVLFFVDHSNDIDHLTPVVYKLCESRRARPVVIVTELEIDIQADYRLRFLQEKYGVPVLSALRVRPPNPVAGLLSLLFGMPVWRGFLHKQALLFQKALRKVFFNKKWADGVLGHYQPEALIFAWADPTVGTAGAFVSAGRDRGIPSLSLPHGMFIYTNDLVNIEEKENGKVDREYFNLFDRWVVQSNLNAVRDVGDGVRAENVAVLGSARYCEEWQRINLSIQHEQFTPRKGLDNAYRTVFMLPQWFYNADFDKTIRTLRRLSDEPWLHLVIKPHTREVTARPAYLKELDALPNVEVAGEVGSVSLIRWADAVIVVGSSIALEALLQRKFHLDPEYLHNNNTVFEETGSEWTVHDDEELVTALRQLSQGGAPPYGEEEVSMVVNQLVLGSSGETDILGKYADFILGGWKKDCESEQESILS